MVPPGVRGGSRFEGGGILHARNNGLVVHRLGWGAGSKELREGGGGVGTRPWWLALLACGGAYWPLTFAFARGGGGGQSANPNRGTGA